MVQNSYDSGRRILTFPAIHPCHAVSPNTLLSSLITLAHSICKFRSKNFVSQKRNAREAIRQVEILVIFLEEVKFNNPVVPQSIVLCFFELHIAFQKIRYLLEDCTCEGSRLWILMKSKRVTIEFQGLMRSIATALDVVPFGSLVLSVEVEEMVLLLARQAQKWKTEVDPDDVRVRFLVVSVLNQFENGNHPNPIDLKRVLEYLEIGSWSLCNKEIKFLEEEIEFEGEEREVAFLSSLVGFMSYCRVVMFDVVDGHGNAEEVDGRQDKGILNCLNPEDFRCPISLEVMKDPVTLSTGQTYDRASILKWFKAGNLSCPKTGEKLTAKDFVPNLLLQKLIWRYCSNYGIQIAEMGARSRDITRTIRPGSPSAAEAMRLVSEFLASRLIVGTCVDRNKAAYEIRSFTKSNLFNRSCLFKAGTIPLLLNLLSSMDSLIQENSMAALLNLSKHSTSKSVIVENGGLILILDVLKEGLSLESRQLAAATLFYISSIKEYRKLIGEMPGAIPALVELARDGNPRGKKNSVVALYGLLILPENHQRVLESGAVAVIVDLLRGSERSDLITDSLAVLSALAEKPDGVTSILCTTALHLLVGILHSSSSRITKEYCVSILLSVCINGGVEVVSSLQKSSSLMTSLYSLLTDGTSRASKKASSIINILLGLNNPNPSSLPTPVVRQERFVHVR